LVYYGKEPTAATHHNLKYFIRKFFIINDVTLKVDGRYFFVLLFVSRFKLQRFLSTPIQKCSLKQSWSRPLSSSPSSSTPASDAISDVTVPATTSSLSKTSYKRSQKVKSKTGAELEQEMTITTVSIKILTIFRSEMDAGCTILYRVGKLFRHRNRQDPKIISLIHSIFTVCSRRF